MYITKCDRRTVALTLGNKVIKLLNNFTMGKTNIKLWEKEINKFPFEGIILIKNWLVVIALA